MEGSLMAEDKKKPSLAEAVAGDAAMSKIGSYQEATGGGTPIPKGEKLKDHPEAHRVKQPRDENGQFTYNSANAKTLKYGPSRGVTVPPFLRGVEMVWAVKAKTPIVYEGSIYLAGRDITAKQFVNMFKEYSSDKGFGDVMDKISKKRGRRSRAEQLFVKSGKTGTVPAEGEELTKLGYSVLTARFGDRDAKKTEVKKNIPTVETNFKKASTAPKSEPIAVKEENVKVEPAKGSSAGDFDLGLRERDPEAFIDKYGDEIEKIIDYVAQYEIGREKVLEFIGNGTIKNFEQVRKTIEEG